MQKSYTMLLQKDYWKKLRKFWPKEKVWNRNKNTLKKAIQYFLFRFKFFLMIFYWTLYKMA